MDTFAAIICGLDAFIGIDPVDKGKDLIKLPVLDRIDIDRIEIAFFGRAEIS